MIERAFVQVFKFEEIGFEPETVNGLRCREAEAIVHFDAFSQLRLEIPELHCTDFEYFNYSVDWIAREVEITEKMFEYQD